jgi:hypothetical protein
MTDAETTPKRRRWWLILLGAAVVLVVVVVGGAFAVGSMLGEEVTSSVSMTFAHPPHAVWDGIADYENNPVSASMRRETIALPDEANGPAWQEDIGSSVITVRTLESEAPARVVRSFADGVVPMTARVEYLIEPEGGGATVTMNSVTTIKDGTWHVPIFRVMQRLAPDAGSRAYLSELKVYLNAKKGENADELS